MADYLMHQDVKQAWYNALLSERFTQTQYFLKERRHDGVICHCVQGVLAELAAEAGVTQWKPMEPTNSGLYEVEGHSYVLPDSVIRWAGLDPADVEVKRRFRLLGIDNDSGRSFQDLARIIDLSF